MSTEKRGGTEKERMFKSTAIGLFLILISKSITYICEEKKTPLRCDFEQKFAPEDGL